MRLGFSIFGVDITIVDTDSTPIDPDAPTEEERLDVAEEFIHEQSALYRHYCIDQVQSDVEQFTGVQLSDEEAVDIVTRLRTAHSMGPISEWNMPGYISDEE